MLFFGIANCHSLQRIKECGITCSQAVHCKSKPAYDIFFLFCRTAPDSLSPHALENMKISTVMKCTEQNRCSLYLNVIGTVILDENIRGVEICSMTLGSQHNQCIHVRITKNKLKKSHKQKIHVQANCFEVGVSDHVYVTMKTVPYYCSIELTQQYQVEDCHNKDVGNNVISCISGRLDYTIKRENSTKSVILPYSKILPCLCIEGWTALPDSRRTRLCPFKDGDNNLSDPVNIILPESHLCA
ncbi:interleukin-17 receptor E-like protein isoform X3 [Pseudophryne corroboree]|uniref:interleukin-17 receptor E-like protein isoform X3 n=1 Tax=Pseudophryne corroboree TaxID=495146 RepID=UPI003081F907